MQELHTPSPATPNSSQEILIKREVTFRNSTFGALKTYIREHRRRTGETLTNAAALDMILRAHLSSHIHQDAVKTMLRLSQPQTLARLQVLPLDATDELPAPPAVLPREPIIKVVIPVRRLRFSSVTNKAGSNV